MKRAAWLVALVASLAMFVTPVTAQMNTAELKGTVVDLDGAPLPGVIVVATNTSTGQSRSTVTSARGTFLMPALQVGTYELSFELTGFRAVNMADVKLAIGSSVEVNPSMELASVEERVTVRAETPLVDTKRSNLSGLIDDVQVEQLPVNGRNWVDFANLAPGVKGDTGEKPFSGVADGRVGSHWYVDGAAVQTYSTTGTQTEVSKDIIGEFEVLTNRFDATLGHSMGVVLNAVTKGGGDRFSGSAFFYFRDDALNAADFFTGEVEPYRNTQYGGTFGGPIVRGKTHFFVNYERQYEPTTKSASTGFPVYDATVDASDEKNMAFARVDHAFNQNHRVNARVNRYTRETPFLNTGGSTIPYASTNFDISTWRYNGGWTGVFGDDFVNQLNINYTDSTQNFSRTDCDFFAEQLECPTHQFPSFRLGPQPNVGFENHNWGKIRNDASLFFEKGGTHNFKFGGEYETGHVQIFFPNATNGVFFYDEDPANLATCCPGTDQDQWDTSQFPIPTRYQVGLGNFLTKAPNDIYGIYVQDDWTIGQRFTLNLGLRYDLEDGSLAHKQLGLAAEPKGNDTDNIQPRLGFTWDVTGQGQTIIRGGGGLYYDMTQLNLTYNQLLQNSGENVALTVFNPDGDPGFASDPLDGQGFEELRDQGGIRNVSVLAPGIEQPNSLSFSLGFGHQLGDNFSVSADYVHTRSDDMHMSYDTNLFCCVNGFPVPINSGVYPELGGFVEGAGRPNPNFGAITYTDTIGKARYHGLQIEVKKRLSNNYQFGITYLLSKNEASSNGSFTPVNNPFNIDDEFGRSGQDQRHRFTANWVAFLPWGVNFNGILFAASGNAYGISTGGLDLHGDGSGRGDRPTCGLDPRFDSACATLGLTDGERVPPNPLTSDAVFRIDVRASKGFQLTDGVELEVLAEVFNLFNRQNNDPSRFNGNLLSSQFTNPGRSSTLAYLPRQLQLGVRLVF